jgi:NAD-dependent SIR2 family protein deacetylase
MESGQSTFDRQVPPFLFPSKLCYMTGLPLAYAHMAIAKLCSVGLIKYVTTTNCDSLHYASGIANQLSEVHGNTYVEECEKCKTKHRRDYGTRNNPRVHRHETGRFCSQTGCDGELLDTIVNFGENELDDEWNRAEEHSKQCDLSIVLGSSMRVHRACELPITTANLCIVNLQKTPYDDKAMLRVHTKTDLFMKLLMQELDIQVPDYIHEQVYQILVEKNGLLRTLSLRIPEPDRHVAAMVDHVTFRITYKNNGLEYSEDVIIDKKNHFTKFSTRVEKMSISKIEVRMLLNVLQKQYATIVVENVGEQDATSDVLLRINGTTYDVTVM